MLFAKKKNVNGTKNKGNTLQIFLILKSVYEIGTFLCFQRLKALEDSESSGQPEIPPPSYREALRLNIKAKHQMPKVENS